MDELRAAILRPQLARLDENVARWNERYRIVEAALARAPGLEIVPRPAAESIVGSSIQFLTKETSGQKVVAFCRLCNQRGIVLKWFGADAPQGYTSRHDSWRYAPAQALPQTDALLARLLDMRLPLTFSLDDCRLIGEILVACAAECFGTADMGAAV